MRGCSFRPGDRIHGNLHDIRNKWFAFDGRVPHAACQFSGTRFSLVYFTSMHHRKLNPEPRARLQEFGFRLPHSSFQCHQDEECGSEPGGEVESARSNLKALDTNPPRPGRSTPSPDGRTRSKSPEKDVRFSKTKMVISYGTDRPPREHCNLILLVSCHSQPDNSSGCGFSTPAPLMT